MTTAIRGVSMPVTVRQRDTRRNYPTPVPVTMESFVAGLMGCTPDTAHQWAVGCGRVDERAAAIILGYYAEGRPARAVEWARPITKALAGIRPAPFSRDIYANAQAIDLREDLTDNALQLVDPMLTFATAEARATGRRDVSAKREAATAELLLADAMESAIDEAEARAEGQQ